MTKPERDALKSACDEAAKFHASVVWANGGKHSQLIVTLNGQHRPITLCCTPRSGDNQIHWMKQRVRQIVRELA